MREVWGCPGAVPAAPADLWLLEYEGEARGCSPREVLVPSGAGLRNQQGQGGTSLCCRFGTEHSFAVWAWWFLGVN